MVIFNPLIELLTHNGYIIYVDIMTGENFQLMLLTWNSLNGQFVHPVRGDVMG